MLDGNDDGIISKFEFATGFDQFRNGVVALKDAEIERQNEIQRREERMAGTKTSATKTGRAVAASRAKRPSVDGGGGRGGAGAGEGSSAGAGAGGIRKVASPTGPTKVRGASMKQSGGGGSSGGGSCSSGSGSGRVGGGSGGGRGGADGGGGGARKKRGIIAQVTRGVGKLFGLSVDDDGDDVGGASPSSSSPSMKINPSTLKKSPSGKPVEERKWFGQSFLEMFGLKSVPKVTPAAPSGGSLKMAERGEPPPDMIWVKGTKAEGYRVNVVKSSSLKKLQGLFHDMDSDRDGHITFEGFNASMDGSNKGPSRFQRDVFDRISNEDGLCTYKNMLQVLYPGASHEQVHTMLQMSKSEADDILKKAKERGPSREQVEQAETVFNTYNINKDGSLSEAEFAKGLSATGVYSHEDAIKEFNRMDMDDSKTIDLKEFTLWYVAMDEIGKKTRRGS